MCDDSRKFASSPTGLDVYFQSSTRREQNWQFFEYGPERIANGKQLTPNKMPPKPQSSKEFDFAAFSPFLAPPLRISIESTNYRLVCEMLGRSNIGRQNGYC